MSEINGIKDRESLEIWLTETGQSRQNCIMLAHRAAMRVAPLIWEILAPVREDAKLTASRICRPLLISGVAALGSTPEIRAAAATRAAGATRAATAAIRAAAATRAAGATRATRATRAAAAAAGATRAAATAATTAATTATTATAAAAAATWKAVRGDCLLLQEGGHIPPTTSLWGSASSPLLDD